MSENLKAPQPENSKSGLNLNAIQQNITERFRGLSTKAKIIYSGLALSLAIGAPVAARLTAEIDEGIRNAATINQGVGNSSTKFQVEAGVSVEPLNRLNDTICAFFLADEGLENVPNGCWWQMNQEGRVLLHNESGQLLIVTYNEKITQEEIDTFSDLTRQSIGISSEGYLQEFVEPNNISTYVVPSEIRSISIIPLSAHQSSSSTP
jgi:hypothetical protein